MAATAPRRRSRAIACAAAAAIYLAASGPAASTFATPGLSASLRGRVALAAGEGSSMCFGHTLQPDGTWQVTEVGVPIQSPEEDAAVKKGWMEFKRQYSLAAKKGMYMDTPVAEEDVKYRFRLMRDNFGISTEKTLSLLETDALPMVIDADYVKGTFDAMVEGASREKALEIITRHPGVLAAGKDIKDNMFQADLASQMIAATRPLANAISGGPKDDEDEK
mmetsp:Transcript_73322/g.192247  ORF Transcript_73322/g.192247 Transcript_73322/m.192247 type:complete len:221 (+) Transcript_73322:65-727(+)